MINRIFPSSRRSLAVALIVVLLFGGGYTFLRSPYVSNKLKRIILREIQKATGQKVIADKIYINAFPFFVGINRLTLFDDKGERVMTAERVKGYISFSELYRRTIVLDRLLIDRPVLTSGTQKVTEIVEHLKLPPGKKKKRLIGFTVRTVMIDDAQIVYRDMKTDAVYNASGADAEIVIRDDALLMLAVKELSVEKEGLPKLAGSLRGGLEFSDGGVVLKSLRIETLGSSLEGTGSLNPGPAADISLDATVLVNSIKELLGLKRTGEGAISLKGKVKFDREPRDAVLDLSAKGDFHLQTLMEALKVKHDFGLKGHILFSGILKGALSNIAAEGKAELTRGNLFGVEVEYVSSNFSYVGGDLRFLQGKGKLYGGKADLSVTMALPEIKHYSVDLSFSSVDSDKLLKLIELDALPLAKGRAKGTFKTSGSDFAPNGRFEFESKGDGKDFIGKIRHIKGEYSMVERKVKLQNFSAKTQSSVLGFEGSVDLASKELDFSGSIDSSDIREIASPYFERGRGILNAAYRVSGTVSSPSIDAGFRIQDGAIDEYQLGSIATEMSFAENRLTIDSLRAEHNTSVHEATGAIEFPEAGRFPKLGHPRYNINAKLSEGDLGGILRLLGLKTDTTGRADALVGITGEGASPVIAGSASIANVVSYGRRIDQADIAFSFEGRRFNLKKSSFMSGSASMQLEGMVSLDKEFAFHAKGHSLTLGLIAGRELPVEARVDFISEGRGTFDDPVINVSSDLRDSTYGGYRIGAGTFKASLGGKSYSFDGRLVDGRVKVHGSGETGNDAAWKAEVGLAYGRYNFILGPVLASPPDDLVLGLEGKVALWGSRGHLNADIALSRLLFNLYGQGFTNIEPMRAEIRDKRLVLEKSTIRGGNTMLSLGGSIVFGGRMDITINGKSSLAPFGALSKDIDSVKGDADFAISIMGTVHSPLASGSIRISEGSVALKSIPQRITDINGTVLVEGSRAVFEGVSAKFGGGEVRLSGSLGFRGLEVTSMTAELFMHDVSVYLSKNFVVDIGGSLYLSGTPESPHINGELWVNRGLYRERIEWKSWLIAGRRTIPRAERDWRERVRLNVRLFGRDDIKVENNIANAMLSLDMFVRGTLGTPLLFGRIDSVEGKVYFRNTQFNIIRANADYSDDVSSSPYIDIYAQANVKGYQVWLNLEGRMQQMDLVLSSDPPLDDIEILALLTLGETGKNLDGLEGGIGAAEATSFLTGEIQDVMEERFTEITGFDRFTIDPYVSSKTGTVTPRVTVGKRLMGDRVFVKYASSLGVENEQELKLELLLGENVSLIGGQETTGSIGGDVVFRFRFE